MNAVRDLQLDSRLRGNDGESNAKPASLKEEFICMPPLKPVILAQAEIQLFVLFRNSSGLVTGVAYSSRYVWSGKTCDDYPPFFYNQLTPTIGYKNQT